MQPANQELLEQAVRAALRRGVPPADAEDIAVSAWERASAAHDPARGPFGALYHRVVQTSVADYWRHVVRRREAPPGAQLALVAPPSTEPLEQVVRNQERLLAALTDDERRLFAAWALQKHLPQGQFPAGKAAASLGVDVPAYENGKRRLKARILELAAAWGLDPVDFFSCAEGEGPRRNHANG